MKLLFISTLLFSLPSFADITCDVTKKVSTNTNYEQTITQLVPYENPSAQIVHRVEVDNMYFSVRSTGENDYLAIVSEGPDYTHGTTVKSGFTERDLMRVTFVFQNTVYTLKCNKL